MADTTPTNKHEQIMKAKEEYIARLEKEIGTLQFKVDGKQKALVRIYRKFGEDMHDCKLSLTPPERMAWMQEIARQASATTVNVKTAIDDTMEISNVEVLKTKKPAKVVGVGVAGEKSGY